MIDLSDSKIAGIAKSSIGDTGYRNIFLTPEENVKELRVSKPETAPVVEAMITDGKDWNDILEVIESE